MDCVYQHSLEHSNLFLPAEWKQEAGEEKVPGTCADPIESIVTLLLVTELFGSVNV